MDIFSMAMSIRNSDFLRLSNNEEKLVPKFPNGAYKTHTCEW